ncbi:HlyD family secretion protein [Marinicellulosiphila megalodicopiae]|uniref:HlyD family secretion protein n=1 Tax=Marinicellulosiphila megalodicopiae TaxID=2724896 RepID=UPI003BB12810
MNKCKHKQLVHLILVTLFACVIVLLQGCQSNEKDSVLIGYIEADYRYVNSQQAGLIVKQNVKAGDVVSEGDVVFELDKTLINLQIKEVQARINQAQALVKDSQQGLRDDEIDSLKAQLNESQTIVDLKQKELTRTQNLLKQGLISKSIGDVASSEFETAQARVNTIQAKIRAANLPARDGVTQSALANQSAIEQQLAQLNWQLSQRDIVAHFSGKIFDVYYEKGEHIFARQPLIAIVPNNELSVKFFVEEPLLSQMKLGKKVFVHADGIAKPIEASISYIATKAQFTPPVIYSKDSREKMVFKLEAIISSPDMSLPLGLPVDVTFN